jgi:hypothetical protein
MKITITARTFIQLLSIVFTTMGAYAQSETEEQSNRRETNKVHYGVETEIMTWINSGYHGSLWLGKNGMRVRFVSSPKTSTV